MGLKNLRSRLVCWRVGVQWYLAATLVPVGIGLAALGILFELGGSTRWEP